MPELTREEKLKLVEKLPQQLQDFLYSEDTGAFLLYLGNKYKLPDEKVRLLSKLTADVVLGITPITSLAREINSKIVSDAQTAMNLAQELNAELLAPVIAPAPSTPATPAPTILAPAPGALSPQPIAPLTAPTPAKPVDKYREPTSFAPEIVDLRKTSPTPAPALTPKPIIPTPAPSISPKPLTPPLTFTRPVLPAKPAPTAPLIEADPHKIPTTAPRPQYIIRPSGLPPTDLPDDNVLDLRKDKGEF